MSSWTRGGGWTGSNARHKGGLFADDARFADARRRYDQGFRHGAAPAAVGIEAPIWNINDPIGHPGYNPDYTPKGRSRGSRYFPRYTPPGSGGRYGRPDPTGSLFAGGNRGLFGQVMDAFSKPIDFSSATPLSAPDFSGLGSVNTHSAPPVRNRGELASRLEGMFRNYSGAYDDYRTGVQGLDDRFALAGPDSFTADREAIEGAVYDRAYNRLAPELERQEQAMLTDLTSRGLAPTSEAYRSMRSQFDEQRQRDLTDLSLASVLAGQQEHQRLADLVARNRAQVHGELGGLFGGAGSIYGAGTGTVGQIEEMNKAVEMERERRAQRQLALRQQQIQQAQAAADAAYRNRQQQIAEMMVKRTQPLQDLTGLLAAVAPGGNPAMPQLPTYGVASPDLMGMLGSMYSANQGAKAAKKGGLLSGLGSIAGPIIGGLFSDERIKEDIVPVGKLDNGLPVVTFKYKGDGMTRIGLIAQDVEKVHPEAVFEVDGMKAVDYGLATQPVAEAA